MSNADSRKLSITEQVALMKGADDVLKTMRQLERVRCAYDIERSDPSELQMALARVGNALDALAASGTDDRPDGLGPEIGLRELFTMYQDATQRIIDLESASGTDSAPSLTDNLAPHHAFAESVSVIDNPRWEREQDVFFMGFNSAVKEIEERLAAHDSDEMIAEAAGNYAAEKGRWHRRASRSNGHL